MRKPVRPEWPTLILLAICYGVWVVATTNLAEWSLAAAIIMVAIASALHASLTHEIVHGHPFPGREKLNLALVGVPLVATVPVLRFLDTHLAHHNDAVLTDPYDDPESNYLDPKVWAGLPRAAQAILKFNNTLTGRLLVGPVLGHVAFMSSDWRAARAGDRRVILGWVLHIPALGVLWLWLTEISSMPIWAYIIAVYGAMSILKIRTFLEHQAHERASGRTVIIEDRGPLAFMFLNNNLHVVHHMHPKVPWYKLPALYAAHRVHYQRRNGGYVFRSYGEVFRRYLVSRKDPVAHPFRPAG
ncbi:fatty acid desaturase [Ovoidimarina sediminis]|uniref:fatty acid desaturase n=1 Tax=Ovoidimarina sediminis TaxID=3079856 RepID=UPI002914302E|nr:fatty acid desaturase [Rhodophyticola sp. MJ-SS7]MDU8942133.1 fatty acid desaturase [Rhodophyticola sp. MJ-SS7]